MTKNITKAGIFDSGVGGLTVVKSLLDEGLFEEIVYYGDTARVPYGIKDKNTIIRYAIEAIEFFKNFDIDILIVACNTVSAYAMEELKAQAPFEVIGVIEPGVIAVENISKSKDSSILITGTKATIQSGKYKKLLQEKGYKNIQEKATSLFVPMVEEHIYKGKVTEAIMEYYFKDIQTPDILIMGCTHFPLISEQYKKIFKNTTLIHSGDAIVKYLHTKFSNLKKFKNTKIRYFATENPEKLKEVAKEWLS